MKNQSMVLLFLTMLVMSAYSAAFIADSENEQINAPISHTLWDGE
ncbi:MAG: hypothetical protein WC748_07970 [Legionellales bacterium]|jgi:hypothetical protein